MNSLRLSRHTLLAIGVSSVLLAACTATVPTPQEADAANDRETTLQHDADDQQQPAQTASSYPEAQSNPIELPKQIDALQAKTTERGLVLTLGDVLFISGAAELNVTESANLGKVAEFLNKYPQRTAAIEAHTDNLGNDVDNRSLSQRRADAVKDYLVGRERIDSWRLTASGKGEASPVADNGSPQGRQQNRRVEVIIAEAAATPHGVQDGRKFPVTKQPAQGGVRR